MALTFKKPTLGRAAQKEGGAPARRMKAGKPRKQQFMLFIGDDGAILVYMEGATVVRRLFAPTASPEHTRTMTEMMQQHPKAPISLLFDVIDQQYVRQTFPPVSPLSVEGLVRRRLDRDFAAEDLRGSIRLGREDTARKDWVYLLIALANTANFQQWVELVVEQPNHLLGALLVPVECQNLIPLIASAMPNRPAEAASWSMLISHNKVSGFRIVVLNEGKLAFTRVSQAVGEAVPAVIAGNVEQEIQNTIEYIRRLGYSETSGLEIFAVVAAEVRDIIDTSRLNASAINLLSPMDVAEALELHQAALAADRFGDVVIASSYALVRKPALRLYPAYAKKLDQLLKARIGMRAAGALVAALFLLMTGSAVISAFSSMSQAKEARTSSGSHASTLKLLQGQVAKLGEAVNFKNDVAAFYEKMNPKDKSPFLVLKDVAALKAPNATVNEWEWSFPSNLQEDPNTKVMTISTTPPPAASPDSPAPAGPVSIQAKVELTDNFLDNEMVNQAVTLYTQRISAAVRKFNVSINNPEFNNASGAKISVAIDVGAADPGGADQSPATKQQAPVLNILMTGPKAETAENAASAEGEPAPGGPL